MEGMLLDLFALERNDFPDCSVLEKKSITLSIQLNMYSRFLSWAMMGRSCVTSRLVSSPTPEKTKQNQKTPDHVNMGEKLIYRKQMRILNM